MLTPPQTSVREGLQLALLRTPKSDSDVMSPTLRPIRLLADDLINQIAAGEVVDRPASIVKELIENSLDAGASAVQVEVDAGGIERISVADDGHGISPRDLPLALQRHCTSKLADYGDLERIVSLGFRGEALASIGAVADVTLTSRSADAAHAWTIGTGPRRGIDTARPAARSVGTTVTVRELFASVPARRQFLRRPQTELLYIQQLLRGAAFCAPGVAFALQHAHGRRWVAPAARDERSSEQRWRAVFGAEFVRAAQYIDVRVDAMRVFGWVGPPALARSQSDLQYLAVNGRLVRDRQIGHAIRLAHGDHLAPGRHATYALHLEMPPEAVDVNVHPSKTEVRFRYLREVHDLVHSAIRQVVQGASSSPARPAQPAYRSPLTVSTAKVGDVDTTRAYAFPPRSTRTVDASPGRVTCTVVAARFLVLLDPASGLRLLDLWAVFDAMLALPAVPRGPPLLIPARLPPLTADHAAVLVGLRRNGFEFVQIAPEAWVLRGLPATGLDIDCSTLVTTLVGDPELHSDPTAAAARALAASVRVPPRADEHAAWFARWEAELAARDIDCGALTRVLDAAALAGLR